MSIIIVALGLVLSGVTAAVVISTATHAPKKRLARFRQRLTAFQAQQGLTEQSFPLGRAAQARLKQETVTDNFGQKVNRVVLEATLGPDQKPFPFSLELIPHTSPEQRSILNPEIKGLFSATSVNEQTAPHPWSKPEGNQAVFWAILDGPKRAWLKNSQISIHDRTLQTVLIDDRQSDRMHDNQFMHHLSEQLSMVQSLIEAVQQDDFTVAMGMRLAEQPNQKERLRMLDSWLRNHDPQPQPPPELTSFNDCRYPEFWMFFLDNGGDPPPEKRDLCLAQKEAEAQKILHTVFRRQPEQRCRKYALAALNWPVHREAAAEMLTRFEDPRLFPTIIKAYWQKPDDRLLKRIAQHQDPAIVALMLDLLTTGPRGALLPAIEYLSRFGDRSALAPIINARKEVPLLSQGKWEQAVNRLRRRLGPAPETAGALSPVTPDPMQGSLERADQRGQLTTPEA